MPVYVQVPIEHFQQYASLVNGLNDRMNMIEAEMKFGLPITRNEIMKKYSISKSTYYEWTNKNNEHGMPSHRIGGKIFHFAVEVNDWIKSKSKFELKGSPEG